jgi:glycosyltransferase involved in cell wall biosynthesis
MKIALVVTGGMHPSGRGEVIPALLWLAERLAAAHDLHAFVLRHLAQPRSYQLCGATVHDLGRPEGRLRQWRALRRALGEHGPFDVVHAYWVDPAGVAAALAGRQLGLPVVVTCDSGEFASLPEIGYGLQRTLKGRAVVASACRLSAAVHVTSHHMADAARGHGIAPVIVPFGVDLAAVPHHPLAADSMPWRLLQVAALNPVKDQLTLLDALAIVRERYAVHLDLVGVDTMHGRLQEEAARRGLGDCVTCQGFVPHDDLDRFRRAAHLYVQSSRHEAAGVAVLEAAAAGLPIVGTRVGYVSDWADTAAVAVPPGDAGALAAAILGVLADRRRREALAAAARRWAVEHDITHTVASLVELYANVSTANR